MIPNCARAKKTIRSVDLMVYFLTVEETISRKILEKQ
jgi:hypothetical protein